MKTLDFIAPISNAWETDMKKDSVFSYVYENTDLSMFHEYPNSVSIVCSDGHTHNVMNMHAKSLGEVITGIDACGITSVEFDREGVQTVIVLPDD